MQKGRVCVHETEAIWTRWKTGESFSHYMGKSKREMAREEHANELDAKELDPRECLGDTPTKL